MKPVLAAAGLALALLSCSAPDGSERVPARLPLTVMSFNVRWDGFDDGEDSWRFRKGLAAEVIRRVGADVVGLQETSPAQTRDLLARLPGFRSYHAGDRSDVVPILYRADRFRLDRAGGFWLVAESDLSGGTRRCTWVRLVDRSSGIAFRHLNFHLDHRSLPSRERSVVVLSRHLAGWAAADPFVVTGDFNTTEDSSPMKYLRGEIALPGSDGSPVHNPVPLADTFRVLHPDADRVGTAHGFRGGRRGRKIDHVLAAAGTRVLAAEIRRDASDGRYPSDHYPVVARVELRAAPAPSSGRP